MAKPPHSFCDPDEIEGICIHYLSDNGKARPQRNEVPTQGKRKITRGPTFYTIRENALFLLSQRKVLKRARFLSQNTAWFGEVSTPPVAAADQASAIKGTFARRSLTVQEPCENAHVEWQARAEGLP